MMLVSDYDGTIKKSFNYPKLFQKIDLKREIHAINNFVNDGNIFAISSYRKTQSIKQEIEDYKLLYNYLITYNGLVTMDNNSKVINANYLNKDVVAEIVSIANKKGFLDKLSLYNEFGLTKDLENVVMIGIKCSVPINVINAIKEFNVSYEFNRDTIWIHKKTNKIEAINLLKTQLQLEDDEIYTVGDSDHDTKMITYYDGHCISNSRLDKSLYLSIPRVKNVRSLIKKIK